MKVEGSAAWSRVWLLAWMATQATAAKGAVELIPDVEVGVSATDNAMLSPDNPEKATVYQFFPEIQLTQDGTRIDTRLDYRVEAYRYDELNDSEIYQNYNGDFVFALDPENFFFEIGAARAQAVRDPEGTIPLTNLGITSNRVDRDDYYAGPSFLYPFGQNGTAEGSFRRDLIRYDDDAYAKLDNDVFQFSLDNYRRNRGLTWAFRLSEDTSDFEGASQAWEYRQASLELGGWASTGVRLFATGGLESPWDDPRDPGLEDSYWEVGLATSASSNVSVELAAGERSYGSSERVSIDASWSRIRTTLQYAERPSTQGYDYYRDLLEGGLPLDLLDRPGATERYISKSFSWNLDYTLQRTTLALSVFDEDREQRTSSDGTPLEDEAQTYVDLSASWRAGARTELRISAQSARQEFGTAAYPLKSYSIGGSYQLGRKTDVSMGFTRTKAQTGGEGEYQADVVTLSLARRLCSCP